MAQARTNTKTTTEQPDTEQDARDEIDKASVKEDEQASAATLADAIALDVTDDDGEKESGEPVSTAVPITLVQELGGHKAGATVHVTPGVADWYEEHGYLDAD
jgi:hypothetical protein